MKYCDARDEGSGCLFFVRPFCTNIVNNQAINTSKSEHVAKLSGEEGGTMSIEHDAGIFCGLCVQLS